MTAEALVLLVLIGLGLVCRLLRRGWYRYWGASDAEIKPAMLGEAEVPSVMRGDNHVERVESLMGSGDEEYSA